MFFGDLEGAGTLHSSCIQKPRTNRVKIIIIHNYDKGQPEQTDQIIGPQMNCRDLVIKCHISSYFLKNIKMKIIIFRYYIYRNHYIFKEFGNMHIKYFISKLHQQHNSTPSKYQHQFLQMKYFTCNRNFGQIL